MTALLEAHGLYLPGRLERCNVQLNAGELTMLVGPNGAGKTSLLQALAGIGAAEGGVAIDGVRLNDAPLARRRRLLSYLGASRDVRWPLSARDYVALALIGTDAGAAADQVLLAASAEALADRALDRLSTGERTRVMIARALAPGARVLLLDEACANLDPQWQLAAIDLFKAEAARGAAVLLSIHDLAFARDHGDRVIVTDGGRIIADGLPENVLDPALLGSVFGVGWDARGALVRA